MVFTNAGASNCCGNALAVLLGSVLIFWKFFVHDASSMLSMMYMYFFILNKLKSNNKVKSDCAGRRELPHLKALYDVCTAQCPEFRVEHGPFGPDAKITSVYSRYYSLKAEFFCQLGW